VDSLLHHVLGLDHVLGSTDGLVSNLSLLMGVAGSGASREAIIVAGLAGLVAGSLSMALGEYLSVQSSRELLANELRIEASQLAASPDAQVPARSSGSIRMNSVDRPGSQPGLR